MAKYRRRFDILADVIGVAGQGAKRTKIMYYANLSHLLLKKYLEDALRIGFLRMVGKEFFATTKGEEFLMRYQRFSNKYSRVEQDVTALRSEAEELEKMCKPRANNSRRGARRSRLAILG